MLDTTSITDNCTNVNENVNVKCFEEVPQTEARELVVIIRPSFKKFCQDACRTALFNHLLFWIAWKAKDQPKAKIQSGSVTYYATNEELVECMIDSWSEKKVRTEVNALIELGVIGVTKNTKWKTDRTKHFYFGREQYNKLIELCEKHKICLAHVGLPKEVIQLLTMFSETVNCPCLGHLVNLPNANGKSAECNESILPNATSRFYQNNNKDNCKDNCKDTDKDNYERENHERQQKGNVENYHPSTRPSKSSRKFSPEDEKQEEVTLTEQGQHIFEFACKTLFPANKPKITTKVKDECESLALHIKTFEQFKSLLQYVQSKFEAPYHLKNMTNELNDWLQVQNMASKDMQGLEWLPTSHADLEPEATEVTVIETYLPDATVETAQTVEDAVEDFETTDKDLIDKMIYICHDYEQDASIDACLDALSNARDEFSLNNTTLLDFMTEAYRANLYARTCDVQSFFDELYGSLAGAVHAQEQLADVG